MPTLRPFRDYNEKAIVSFGGLQLGPILDMNTIPTMASMNEVVMLKSELIEHLVKNKAKHDVILATAIAGYWDTAASQLETKRKVLHEQVEIYKADVNREIDRVVAKVASKETLPAGLAVRQISIDVSLGLVYPQDHSQDYERAIRMMESSVFEQVRLSVEEYDAYVLNNWEWKANFLATNTFYVDTMRKKQGVCGPTGPAGSVGRAGSYGSYQKAQDDAINLYAFSGCLPNNF